MNAVDGTPGADLDALDRLVDDELWPAAIAVDAMPTIPAHHYEALAALGLHGMLVPRRLGGLGLDPRTARRTLRTLGRGCGATAFAFAQHHGVAAALSRTDNQALAERWLPSLLSGTLAGTAFAHVRRAGPSAVRAEPDGDGFRLYGEAPWATSWGSARIFSVAALDPDGRIVWVVVPGDAADGLTPSAPLDLMVFGATATVRLRFDGYRVGAADVVSVEEAEPWRRADRRGAVRPNPLCLGVGDRALRLLADSAPEAAEAWIEPWARLGAEADAAAAAVDDGSDEVDAIAAVRARSVLTVQRLTTALLAAVGGRGAERS
ncbi:MAG: acyl-CoA dehydrogenase family protein, partial [Actinomycetota bacterium]